MALVGIARLAAESQLLEAKRTVEYFEIPARSILNRTKPNMPFQWTINPYRGCEIGCKYCYARYTHEFMEMDPLSFEDKIYAKAAPGRPSCARNWHASIKRDDIAIGTATDPYQPAERRFGRTRAILEVFARERGWHLGITTKSDLIVRDIDLLKEIARRNVLGVNITITTLDEKLARLLEPRAPRSELRLEAVRRLRAAGICVARVSQPDDARDHRFGDGAGRGGARGARTRAPCPSAAGRCSCPAPRRRCSCRSWSASFRISPRAIARRSSKSIHLSRRYKDALAREGPPHPRALRPDQRHRSNTGRNCGWKRSRCSTCFPLQPEGWMQLADFDYHLPEELIAQEALADRAASRMLVVYRERGPLGGSQVSRLPAIPARRAIAWC